jgi:hypothetical protein
MRWKTAFLNGFHQFFAPFSESLLRWNRERLFFADAHSDHTPVQAVDDFVVADFERGGLSHGGVEHLPVLCLTDVVDFYDIT